MDIAITNVHLDLGGVRRGTDMGPSAMHVAGLVPRLQALGHRVVGVDDIEVGSPEAADAGDPTARFLGPIQTAVATIADRVHHALQNRRFPLVLGGDHAQAIGTIAGLSRYYRGTGKRLGVVWVDAHTDMNTPDTSPSGNIHGMPLAVLMGHGPQPLLDVCGTEPVLHPKDVAIIGARDVDASEAPLVKELGVRVYTMSELDERGTAPCVREAFDLASTATVGIHLSFDLDGVDPDEAPGVGTPVPGGLSLRESLLVCEQAHRSKRLIGMEVVELNPTLDVRNKTGNLAVWLILSALGKSIL
ncbi:MAG: arginase [Alphaproteobacteria bacterium]|nr:arginase [Alphaproteobacteria bacterium]